ncbi:TIGR03032 family protein [Sphingosinicellaceae bacterium]|nr:TIGR03032 family protein [Sphingosinicellaceae bacterium]
MNVSEAPPAVAESVQAKPVAVAVASTMVKYSQSGGLVALFAKLNISVAFTSYQSGILYMLGRNAAGAHLHQTPVAKPMGLARDRSGGLLISAGYQILRCTNAIGPDERVNNLFDACYVPRTIHVTGQLDAHDIGLAEDDSIVFVNTRFNCLATVDERNSFRKLWMPPFISELIDEDRCHLNGLAMRDGRPSYVSAVSRSNTVDGWRDRRSDGGVVIDVDNNRIVCTGLSMPHSPRMHGDELWILNSGTGELGVIENAASGTGKFVPKAFCPGFLRGLSFHGDLAFVGLSKPRYERFEGLALDQRLRDADSEPWCGVQVIDTKTGRCVEWFRIDGAVSELYDVEVLPQVTCPMALGPDSPEIVKFVTTVK